MRHGPVETQSGGHAAVLIVLLLLSPPADGAEAPPPGDEPRRALGRIDDVDLGQVDIGLLAEVPDRDKTAPEPLRDVLSREGRFMATVGELSPEETDVFLREGEKSLVAHGGRLVDGVMLFTGRRGVSDFNGRVLTFEEPPSRNARRILAVVLKRISPGARAKFDEESQRLEARRWRAAAIAQVAELDEAVLLSSAQRRKLREMLSTEHAVPRYPTKASALFYLTLPSLRNLITAGSLGSFGVSIAELPDFLRHWQLACDEEARRPMPVDIAIVEQAVRPEAVARGANGDDKAAAADTEVRVRWQMADEYGIVSRTSLEQRLRLGVHLSRLVEDVAQHCDLTQDQREKLLLAGKLDIQELNRRLGTEDFPGRENRFREVARVRITRPRVPPSDFDLAGSVFQKTLEHRLSAEQKRKLAGAWRERRELRSQALVEAVVVGFERTTSLSSAQCEKLSSALNAALAAPESEAVPPPLARQRVKSDWQLACLRRIAQLPDEAWRSCFFDVQWSAAKRQQGRIAEAARRMEAAASGKVNVADGEGGVIEIDTLQTDKSQ